MKNILPVYELSVNILWSVFYFSATIFNLFWN